MRLLPIRSLTLLWSSLLLPSPAKAADTEVRVSSIGYVTGHAKRATVAASSATVFSLKQDADGTSVLDGTLSVATTDPETGAAVQQADFTPVNTPGSYYLEVPGVGRSVSFPIGDDAWKRAFTTAMLGFFGWRCGTPVSITLDGITWSHAAGHLEDASLDAVDPARAGQRQDAVGGWHDAGDYGKYVPTAAQTLGMMLQAWEQFGATLSAVPLRLPEQGGTYPDFLDEVKWEADWLRKMQYGPTDGRVYHQLKTQEFAGFVLPAADTEPRYFAPYSSTATADYVAALAKASRAIAPYDPTRAADWLAAAQVSYAWLTNHPDYQPVAASPLAGSIAYESTDQDDRLWAAAEMWETTGDAAALVDFETRANAYGTEKVEYDWDWPNLKNLGMFTYVLSERTGRDPALLADVRAQIVARASAAVGTASRHAYGRFLEDYWWGVNGSVARACMLFQTAHAISPNDAYLDACVDQVAFLYGRNPYDRSFVTEEGIDPPHNPHHRPSGGDSVDAPYPGLLVGGGWPTATSWQDVQGDYEQNEVAINWNGALVYALAGFVKPGAWDGEGGAPTHVPRGYTGSLDLSGPPEMIDDLEDGDLEILKVGGRNGWWGTNVDGTAAAPRVMESVTPGADSSSHAIHYRYGATTGWGGALAIALKADPNQACDQFQCVLPYDASTTTGVRFRAKGTVPGQQLELMVGDINTFPPAGVCTTCWDSFTKVVTLSTDWQEYLAGWDEFRQAGWGVPAVAAIDPAQIFHINFQHLAGAPWEIWVDDVAFAHPRSPVDADAGAPDDAGDGSAVTSTPLRVAGGGCGCRIARSPENGALAALVLTGLVLLASRRRRG